MRLTEVVFPTHGIETPELRSCHGYAAQAPPATGERSPYISDNDQLGMALEATFACAEGQVPFMKYFSL